jgi:hypothetical protein
MELIKPGSLFTVLFSNNITISFGHQKHILHQPFNRGQRALVYAKGTLEL